MELIEAAEIGNVGEVRRLAQQGYNVNQRENNDFGYTALLWASQQGHLNVVKCLIKEFNVDVMQKDLRGCSCFYRAARCNQITIVKYLASKNPSLIDEPENEGRTPLWIASFKGHEEMVEYLANQEADVEKLGVDRTTTLRVACQEGKLGALMMLVEKGQANILAKDIHGRTGFFMAAAKNHITIVKYLVSKDLSLFDEPDNEGRTPLWIASFKGHEEMVEYLVKQGANIEKLGVDRTTPLRVACQEGKLGALMVLAEKGQANILAKDIDGRTGFFMAAQNNHVKVMEYLQQNGANINQTNNNNCSPLYIACQKGNKEAVEYLIQNKADVELALNGFTPLMTACSGGNLEIVKMLLLQGKLNLDTRNQQGKTALDIAKEENQHEIVSCYLKHLLLISEGNLELVKILVVKGNANLEASRQSSLKFAEEKGHIEEVKYLQIQLGVQGSLQEFEKGKNLGQGSFGSVDIYAHKRYGNVHLAVKELKKVNDGIIKQYETEVNAMKKLSLHENIVEFYGSFADKNGSLFLCMEICDSDLKYYKNNHPNLDFKAKLGIFIQIAAGIQHMHYHNIIHRDLKPGNVLVKLDQVTGKSQFKIADFGLAKIQESSGSASDSMTATGTRVYMAPEVLLALMKEERTEKGNRFKVDIFSIGVIYFWLLVGEVPFKPMDLTKDDLDPAVVTSKVTQGDLHPILCQMMQKDRKDRPDILTVYSTVKQLYDTLE